VRSPSRENGRGPAPLGQAPERATTPLPGEFTLSVDPATTTFDDGRVLMGGSPLRLLRVTSRACALIRQWGGGLPVGDRKSEQILARRLVASGVFVPHPGGSRFSADDLTVVIPVRDRPEQVRRLLSALKGMRCIVVDDASADPARTREVVEEAGGTLLSLEQNSGPSVARNTGLAQVATPLVVFIDSDCVPEPGWLGPLLGHFDDPLVAAAAPRILPMAVAPSSPLSRYESVRSSLDRGGSAGLVRPLSRIPYVPSATLLVRREAVADELFDPQLRGGEDVDLVWRLVDAGWDVRYEPSSVVRHDGPRSIGSWVSRRTFYGSTAGLLARRHPGALVPLQTSVWTAGVWAFAGARKPFLAAASLGASVWVLARRLKGLVDDPVKVAGQIAVGGTAKSALPALGGLTRAWSPALVAALFWPRTRRSAALALLVPAVANWVSDRPDLDLIRYTALHLADDVAYGSGVWLGSLKARTLAPLIPHIALRPRVWSSASLRSQLKDPAAH
jgi:mycofactocin system glycosyltransferase